MANIACFDKPDFRRAAQYLVTVVAVLLIGYVLSILPVMTRLEFVGVLLAADLILFVSRAAALVFFFLFARHALAAIPEHSGILSFFKGIAEPAAVLIIVIIGQDLLWQVIEPFVGGSGKTVYFGGVIALIVSVGVWLVFCAYRQAAELLDSVQYVTEQFLKLMSAQKNLCSSCGGKLTKDAKFCSHCGHKVEATTACLNCGQSLEEGQKYCQNCGKAVVVIVQTDSER
ncbi:MAG: zinc ribbon domain-containing protein [Gammaproteobacteria bacterium]